jgi:hypothetical protein
LTGPGNIQAGTNLDFSFQVRNIGNANGLGFVRLNYFLRSVENNQLFSLPYQDISPLKRGQSLTVNASEQVPFFIPGGNYNLVVKVDELFSQVELNENNNSAQIPLQVAIFCFVLDQSNTLTEKKLQSIQPEMAIPVFLTKLTN